MTMNNGLKRIIALIGISSVSILLSKADHYDIYLLSGQSNANGRGDAAELVAPYNTAQNDVLFYYHKTQNATNNSLPEDQWISLAPGSGHGTYGQVKPIELGPEVGFGRTLADARPARKVAILKYAHGGSDLHTEWSATGSLYATFLSNITIATRAIHEAGHTYQIKGMLWQQGEADAGSATTANAYEANLTSLINRVRNDVFDGQPMPFIIGKLSTNQTFYNQTPGSPFQVVRAAQDAVAANLTNVTTIHADGPDHPVRADKVHFSGIGQRALGVSHANAILALEAAADQDLDGLLDTLEATLGTDPDNPDTDGDGQNDAIEYLAGTSPLDASETFKVTSIQQNGEAVSLSWPSKEGNSYEVETSQDLVTWTVLQSHVSAHVGTQTTWQSPANLSIAFYGAEGPVGNGNFNTSSFDSTDGDPLTDASRLSQGGNLNGGGANSFVLNNTFFTPTISGNNGFNLAGITSNTQTLASSGGHYIQFTIQAHNETVDYESLSFYSNQSSSGTFVDVGYTVGADPEVMVLTGHTPTLGNATVTKTNIDFPNFSTSQDVVWRFYLYGTAPTNHGVRFDDIDLKGSTSSGSRCFYRVRLLLNIGG